MAHFTHDCTNCIALGDFEHTPNQYADLYFCPGPNSTLVARTSSYGPDYISGPDNDRNGSPLREAAKRARRQGLFS